MPSRGRRTKRGRGSCRRAGPPGTGPERVTRAGTGATSAATAGHAFSNEPFELHNNHGRIFGPFPIKGGWLFIGALSRERFDPRTKTEHIYVSFNQARDDLARKLEEAAGYAVAGYVELANALADAPALSTGDHDGRAVVLRTIR